VLTATKYIKPHDKQALFQKYPPVEIYWAFEEKDFSFAQSQNL
jgi:hypothetical protein